MPLPIFKKCCLPIIFRKRLIPHTVECVHTLYKSNAKRTKNLCCKLKLKDWLCVEILQKSPSRNDEKDNDPLSINSSSNNNNS